MPDAGRNYLEGGAREGQKAMSKRLLSERAKTACSASPAGTNARGGGEIFMTLVVSHRHATHAKWHDCVPQWILVCSRGVDIGWRWANGNTTTHTIQNSVNIASIARYMSDDLRIYITISFVPAQCLWNMLTKRVFDTLLMVCPND